MALMCIRMELARTPEFPDGSSRHGYEFIAPLDTNGHIDAKEWAAVKDRCSVTRFWGSSETEQGLLRHAGQGWRFDYDKSSGEDDEPFFKLDRHTISEGAYVSVTEHDKIQRPFKIVSVTRLAA